MSSLLFDGVNDNVNFGTDTDSIPFTCGAWIYPLATPVGTTAVIIARNNNAASNFWRLSSKSANHTLEFRISFSTTNGLVTSTAAKITNNEWQFVAGKVTSTNIYVYHGTTPDGITDVSNSTTNPSGTHTDSSENVTVGDNSTVAQAPFNTRMAWPFVVKADLSLDEIKHIAEKTWKSRDDFSLISPLNDGLADDWSNNNNHGTINGAVTVDSDPPLVLLNSQGMVYQTTIAVPGSIINVTVANPTLAVVTACIPTVAIVGKEA